MMSKPLSCLLSQSSPLYDIQASPLFVFAVYPSVRSPSLYPGTSNRCPRGKKQEPARRPVHQLNSISGGDIEGAPKGPRAHTMSPPLQGLNLLSLIVPRTTKRPNRLNQRVGCELARKHVMSHVGSPLMEPSAKGSPDSLAHCEDESSRWHSECRLINKDSCGPPCIG
jgi:hypothetical protein